MTATKPSTNGVANFNFAHLRLDNLTTARYDLPLVSPGAHLVGHPAMETNRKYRDGLLALSGDRIRRSTFTDRNDEDDQLDRDDDLKLYPEHVITGWGGITDTDGNDVPFTVDNCAAFLKSLPEWLFDRVRVFFKVPENFIKRAPIRPPQNVSDLVGN